MPVTVRYNITITFRDDKGGVCSNSIFVGSVDRTSTTYTVVSGAVQQSAPAPASQQSVSVAATTTEIATPNYDNEAERLYREYVSGLRRDEHKAFIAPTYTGTGEAVKLLIHSFEPENAAVTVTSANGSVTAKRSVRLQGGITEVWLEAHEKPQVVGMYYVMVEYANGSRETLKGMVK